jgi:hypothetical protein
VAITRRRTSLSPEDVKSCEGPISCISETQFCFLVRPFSASFDGGPTLSPELLRELADFGVPVFIDNYFEQRNQEHE